MTVQWITMRGYIGGSENVMLQGFPSDWVFVLYNSPKGPEHPDAGRCSLLHYPRYPWEQRGSYGNYTVVNELKCWIMHSPDTSGEGTVHQAEKKVRHQNCSTASPSSQGKLFCTQLRDAFVG